MTPVISMNLTSNDWEVIQDEFLVQLDHMEKEYETVGSILEMFYSDSDFFQLPDIGLYAYISISSLYCELNIVPQSHPLEEGVLKSRRVAMVNLCEPIIPRRNLGDNSTQSERLQWINNTRAKVEAGEFGNYVSA